MNPLYSVAEIRATELSAARALPPGTLMQRAGLAVAAAALDLLPPAPIHASVLLLAGPGNNGGDALEAAAHLIDAGVRVAVWLAPVGAAPQSAERQQALQRARRSAPRFVDAAAIEQEAWQLVVDGLFGIGLGRPLAGEARQVAERINAFDCPVLALDVPSGLDADTGAVLGPDGVAVRASRTLTFIGDKPGLHTCDGRDHAGQVRLAGLDIGAEHFGPARAHLNEPAYFARHARARRQNSHKGSYGNVAVLGGAPGMTGAPLLAARTALYSGAGRVYLAFPQQAPAYDPGLPELMCRLANDVDFRTAALVAGPGLGASARAHKLLLRAIMDGDALLLDADALNLLAAAAPLRAALARRAAGAVLTPHPLEAARLLAIGADAVQADRPAAARALAARLNATVVLKGSGTVIAAPDGRIVINPTGNAALATAGTGDVLAGLCGALLAQGWPAWEAALAAVWLHGAAADALVGDGVGPIGLTAHELVPAIRIALNQLLTRQLAIQPAPGARPRS